MPAISMFYGIIIKMYNNGEHNPPHFHASYQGYYATFNFDGELIEGTVNSFAQISSDILAEV